MTRSLKFALTALTALTAAALFCAVVLARHGVTAADVLNAFEWTRPYAF